MNNEIIVMEKPDRVSWDCIHEVLWEAHASTRELGIYYPTSEMTGDELKDFIDKHNGRCIVAIDGDKMVGTVSHYVNSVCTRWFDEIFNHRFGWNYTRV